MKVRCANIVIYPQQVKTKLKPVTAFHNSIQSCIDAIGLGDFSISSNTGLDVSQLQSQAFMWSGLVLETSLYLLFLVIDKNVSSHWYNESSCLRICFSLHYCYYAVNPNPTFPVSKFRWSESVHFLAKFLLYICRTEKILASFTVPFLVRQTKPLPSCGICI